jgi:hypothetical protein
MPPPPKETVIDVLALAVGKSALREQVEVDELRTLLSAAYSGVADESRLRLQFIWDLCESRDGFDAKVAAAPMCWLKSLEPRLGMVVELPTSIAGLKTSDIATNAAKCFIKRDDVDRLLGPDAARQSGSLGAIRLSGANPIQSPAPGASRPSADLPTGLPTGLDDALAEPGAPPVDLALEPGAPPVKLSPPPVTRSRGTAVIDHGLTPRQKKQAILSIAGLLISLVVLALVWRANSGVAPATVDGSAFAGIPVAKAERLGADVRLTLSDGVWLQGELSGRDKALRGALDDLHANGVNTVTVVDEHGRARGGVQWIDGRPKVVWFK